MHVYLGLLKIYLYNYYFIALLQHPPMYQHSFVCRTKPYPHTSLLPNLAKSISESDLTCNFYAENLRKCKICYSQTYAIECFKICMWFRKGIYLQIAQDWEPLVGDWRICVLRKKCKWANCAQKMKYIASICC